ncbi:helix-turn-helix domain-containing protein [Tenacibaculum sp. M341]|uniref:helix-turn-helix domain-containing protein n=1 Tax=Tenacibaculum sp. M341 TaxID=2530339 RepID=UPI001045227D|nr:helix-turn-helix transcriptional regulator [Tenacibaculum sp. M341]TCI91014.1 XRE family transcriptional regulator [Tenacibaculum sp. M341]
MIDRIKTIIEYYNLSSSTFAEKIDVPRSSISHLLSGRNKPSLDFIMKVDKAFDDVNLDWLLYGKGSFNKKSEVNNTSLFNTIENEIIEKQEVIKETDIIETKEKIININKSKSIVKVILLFDDGSFKAFNQ